MQNMRRKEQRRYYTPGSGMPGVGTGKEYSSGKKNERKIEAEKWKILVNGTARSMSMIKEMRDEYERMSGTKLIPWVGGLGSRKREGAVGMSVVVERVAKWIDEGKADT